MKLIFSGSRKLFGFFHLLLNVTFTTGLVWSCPTEKHVYNRPCFAETSSAGADTPVWLGLENNEGTACTADDCTEVLTW